VTAPTVALGLASVAVLALLLDGSSLPVVGVLLAVGVPLGAWLAVRRLERLGIALDIRVLAVAIGALLAVAVVRAPATSRDLWSYTMYGRMVSQYGVSPYTHVPAAFPHDPFLHLVGSGWRHTPSVYGPAFVAFSAAGTAVAGGSALIARLVQELGAGVAVAIALVLVWRRTRSPAAVMLLGVNPLVVVSVVNGGHNDALVGLGVLGAVLLVERHHPVRAAAVLALAALVKITALLALPALAVWIGVRHGPRLAAKVAWIGVASVGAGYAVAGWAAVRALDANHRLMSRASVWQLARAAGRDRALGVSRLSWTSGAVVVAPLLVGILALAVAWQRRGDAELAAPVALALCAYFVAAVYVLPWYGMWALPAASTLRRGRIPAFVAGLGAFVTAVYALKERALPGPVDNLWWWLGAYLGPVLLLGWFLAIGLGARGRARSRLVPA
jgi:alpha-1,6-mannosyltransferase